MSRSNISSGIMSRMKVFENDNNNDDPTGEITIITESLTSITTTTTTAGPSDRSNFAGRVENHEQPCGQTKMMMSSPPPGVQTDADGLILPKKIINPCLESTDRKQLHRELKFNTKVGKSVLNQKSELQRAYEKQKERQQLHNQVQQESSTSPTFGLKGELSRVIMERQQKHAAAAAETRSQDSDDDERQYVNPEYLNARAKLRAGQRSELK